MADKDPWLGRTWKVYAVQGAGGAYLKPMAKEGVFTLTAVADASSGATAHYTVSFASGDMPPCWQGLLLYPEGTTLPPPPSPLLKPWTQAGDAPWLAAADTVRENLNDATARLEAVLTSGGQPMNLILVAVPDATTSDTPLLVMQLENPPGAVHPMDNPGTGHGDN